MLQNHIIIRIYQIKSEHSMKKLRILVVLAISTLLLIPFGSFTRAQPSSYVGVEEGDVYTWRIDLDVDGIDELVTNVDTLLDDLQLYVADLDLGGYEDLTIPETLENISSTVLNTVFPVGWEDLNVTELIEAFISNFVQDANSTMFAGNIPSNWQSLNVTTFADYVVDGLNDTLPAGWEVNPIPELIKLAINTFNNSLLFGLVPDGWADLTIGEFLDALILQNVPEAYESFMLHMSLNQLADSIPSGMGALSLEDLISSVLPTEAMSINVSYVLEMLQYRIPPQYQSVNMSTIFHILMNNISSEMPSEFVGVTTSEIIDDLIDEVMVNITALLVPAVFSPGFEDDTIQELINDLIGELINQWDTVVFPQWTANKALLTAIPSIGFRIQIESIGTEIEAYVDGPRGVPIGMTLFISLDFKNWTSITELFGTTSMLMFSQVADPFAILGNLTTYYATYIVNPATYSSEERAFGEQSSLSYGLIMAKNYNWETLKTNFSIPIGSDPNGIFGSAEWNTVGVLKNAFIEANGVEVVKISLLGEDDEIPGYEVAIILALTPITIIGLIYFLKKKNRIKNLNLK